MNRKYAGILLILMMLGHNYVINQPQSLQQDIEHIHSVTVTEFNLLYSIPSILAILPTDQVVQGSRSTLVFAG